MTHKELVNIGYKWLLNYCGVAIKELNTINSEHPDVIGFRSWDYSFIVEAKASRSDYLADKKKVFRIYSYSGMGDFRFYICPKGLIKKEELPNGWGLIYVNEKGKARLVYNPFGKGNIYSNWERNEKNRLAEYNVMYSALRRFQLNGSINKLNSN